MLGGAGSRARRPPLRLVPLRLVPLPHAAPAASSIPGEGVGGSGTRHGPPGRSAFPRTSVGSAAVHFQFLLRAGSAGSSFGFITRHLQWPPPPRTCVPPAPGAFREPGPGLEEDSAGGLRGRSELERFEARHFPDDL